MTGANRSRLAVLTSRVRIEERLIFTALEGHNIPYDHLDERHVGCELANLCSDYAVVVVRSMSNTRSLYAARLFEAAGAIVINSSHVIETCGDKMQTSLALLRAGVPTPRTAVTLTPGAALAMLEQIGYPAVLKPISGSWGRLLAKVNDREAAEAVLEHKQVLGSPAHSVIYIQEYIEKPGRDIRAIVIGDSVISAMYRWSEHWITNTARGASATPCTITDELSDLSLRAARAVGGGAVAVDILERPDHSFVVNEVNHTMEFHGMIAATGVDVAGAFVQYVRQVAGL